MKAIYAVLNVRQKDLRSYCLFSVAQVLVNLLILAVAFQVLPELFKKKAVCFLRRSTDEILRLKNLILFAALIWVVISINKGMAQKQTLPIDPIAIHILYDNKSFDKRLKSDWGFSCISKLPQKDILFDTGGDSSILLSNMKILKINPHDTEVVFLSHIHGDHVGGLPGFLNKNKKVTVYLPASFPQRFKDQVKLLGVKIEEVDKPKMLFENVYTTGELGEGIKEQSLIIKTLKGLIVITGCDHPGVVNVVRKAKEIT